MTEIADKPVIENFEWKRHAMRLWPMVVRYYREINNENLEEEIPMLIDGRWIGVKKIDAKMQALSFEGIFCKVAIIDQEIAGFIWFKELFHNTVLGIEAFYVSKLYRKTKVGQALVNSFQNEFNKGRYTIYATFHQGNPPDLMLQAFQEWETIGPINDRDLVLIKGIWDIERQKEKWLDAKIIHARKLG